MNHLNFIFVFMVALTGEAASDAGAAIEVRMDNAGITGKNKVLAPRLIEKIEFYEVCGSCEKDLQCDLTKKAIKCSDGKKYDSVTDWKLTWEYGYTRTRRTCLVDSFRVTAEITTRLPKWAAPNDAPVSLIEKWNSYLTSLMLHEKGHRDRTVEAAHDLTKAVAVLPAAAICADVDRDVGGLIRFHKEKLILEQKEYDAVTLHGHTEGVSFP